MTARARPAVVGSQDGRHLGDGPQVQGLAHRGYEQVGTRLDG